MDIPMVRGACHFVLLVCLCCRLSIADQQVVLLQVDNPEPGKLPTLGVCEEYAKNDDRHYRYLSATFPNLPSFTCDLWCFESDGITYASAQPLDGGGVQMRHTWQGKDWDIVTTATPHAGSFELVSRLTPTSEINSQKPAQYPSLNMCWQLRRAPGFASKPDTYPEFIKRCFIFTERGQTFLLDTVRRPIPVKPTTHEHNNPPWVQMYLPQSEQEDVRANSTAWADYSPDRYTLPVIGAVSRDRKYLAALATGAETTVSQAWHDCMHNNARWLPAADGHGKEWRVRVYAMENNPEALIVRFNQDFLKIQPWE